MELLQVNKTIFASRWATMIELMAMISILWLGVASMFSVVTWGMWFAKDTEDTIRAINLAREWIEWVTNVRNTNWLRFSSDRINCWKTSGYDSTCIWNTSYANNLFSGSNILYNQNGLWYLSGVNISLDPNSNWNTYYSQYKTYLDDNGFFTQTGAASNILCGSAINKNCRTIFTREIFISPSGTWQISVKSKVYWNTKRLQKIELETSLSNWKAKF